MDDVQTATLTIILFGETRPHEQADVYYSRPFVLWQDAIVVCVCVKRSVCIYGDVVILQPDSLLIYGIDPVGEGRAETREGVYVSVSPKICFHLLHPLS